MLNLCVNQALQSGFVRLDMSKKERGVKKKKWEDSDVAIKGSD